MTTRISTAWLCANCGRPLQQTNTSRRRRAFRHRDPKVTAFHCAEVAAVSVREYRADLRAIARFIDHVAEAMLRREAQALTHLGYAAPDVALGE